MRWYRWLACLLILLVGGASAADSLHGLQRPVQRGGSLSALLPHFGPGRLPGQVVGVLQWDPNTADPQARVILSAGGQVWTNLFVLDPHQGPIDLPVDGSGGRLHLPSGVRLISPTDVARLTLPCLVTVTVNQGRGVSGTNAFLAVLHPSKAWPHPLPPVVQACQTDWVKLATSAGMAPGQDLAYTAWDDHRRQLVVTVVRRLPRQVYRSRDPRDPIVAVPGQPAAVCVYTIDDQMHVVEKLLATAPQKGH